MEDLSIKVCPTCGATWLGGKHIWAGTGKEGCEKSLNNLVCNMIDDSRCINPQYIPGLIYGEADTWAKRRKYLHEGP